MTEGADRAGAIRWARASWCCPPSGGSSFALIKVAVDAGVAPMWVVLWRCLFGTLALGAVCLGQRAAIPRDHATWGPAVVVAALLNAAPFALFAYGETHVSSILAGLWNATTPLTTLVFVLALAPQERPTARRLLGLLVGLVGVLVVLGVWRGLSGATVTGSLACLAATGDSRRGTDDRLHRHLPDPVGTTLLGTLLLPEPLGWNTLGGGLLVIAGALLAGRARRQGRTAAMPAG